MKGILIALVVVGIMAADFDQQLTELQETKFGKTILQTIQMELQTDDPVVANLINMMENLDTTLDGEQKRDDDRITRIEQNCDIDIGQLEEIINTSTVASLTLKSEIDTLTPQKNQAVASLERKINEISDLRAELDYQTLKRNKEGEQYQIILDNLEQALFGVNQVKGYFNSFLDTLVKNRKRFDKPEPSFLEDYSFQYEDQEFSEDDEPQKALTSFAQVANKVNKLKHHVHLEGYKSMLELMSDLANQAHSQQDDASQSEVLAKKVLSILKQIENYIQSERMREDQAEDARSNNFDLMKDMLTDQLVQSNQDKTYMEGLIATQAARLQQAANEKFEVDQKITAKVNEKEDREVDCRLKRNEYDVDTANRLSQKKAIGVAVDLISSKLGQLKRQLLEN